MIVGRTLKILEFVKARRLLPLGACLCILSCPRLYIVSLSSRGPRSVKPMSFQPLQPRLLQCHEQPDNLNLCKQGMKTLDLPHPLTTPRLFTLLLPLPPLVLNCIQTQGLCDHSFTPMHTAMQSYYTDIQHLLLLSSIFVCRASPRVLKFGGDKNCK